MRSGPPPAAPRIRARSNLIASWPRSSPATRRPRKLRRELASADPCQARTACGYDGIGSRGAVARAAKCSVARSVERCTECAPGWPCPEHQACATQPDAAIASEIGAAWARFVRAQVDVRLPWPPFAGRAGEIAFRLVGGIEATDRRRNELARICHWRAGLVWESLERPTVRDRPYEAPAGGRAVFRLPGGALTVHFRTRRTQAGSPPRFTAADAPWRQRGRHGR